MQGKETITYDNIDRRLVRAPRPHRGEPLPHLRELLVPDVPQHVGVREALVPGVSRHDDQAARAPPQPPERGRSPSPARAPPSAQPPEGPPARGDATPRTSPAGAADFGHSCLK
jgi:hypothetical protein